MVQAQPLFSPGLPRPPPGADVPLNLPAHNGLSLLLWPSEAYGEAMDKGYQASRRDRSMSFMKHSGQSGGLALLLLPTYPDSFGREAADS